MVLTRSTIAIALATTISHSVLNAITIKPQEPSSLSKKVYIKLEWGFGYWPRQELEAAFNARGYAVQEVRSLANLHDADYIITYDVVRRDLQHLQQYPKEKCVLVLWEPPIIKSYNYERTYHQLYSKILTFSDAFVDNQKYFKCYYTVKRPMIDDIVPFEQKKFCTLINRQNESNHPSSLLAKRMDAIHFFEAHAPDKLDLFGDGWDSRWKVTRGPIGGNDKFNDKIDVMKHYKYCICYENSREQGYITEKIFDCFRAGCVPIYWGAPDIEQHVPAHCYIDAQSYSSWSDLYTFLETITPAQYETYLANIRAFLASDQGNYFTNDYYVRTLMHVLFGEAL